MNEQKKFEKARDEKLLEFSAYLSFRPEDSSPESSFLKGANFGRAHTQAELKEAMDFAVKVAHIAGEFLKKEAEMQEKLDIAVEALENLLEEIDSQYALGGPSFECTDEAKEALEKIRCEA